MGHRENLKSFTLCSLPTELLAFLEFLLTVPEPFSHKLESSFPLSQFHHDAPAKHEQLAIQINTRG